MPQIERYTPPDGLTSQTGATNVGSEEDGSVPIFSSTEYVTLMAVDGRLTQLTPRETDKPVTLMSGAHVVQIRVAAGGLAGSIATPVRVEAGKIYVLRATRPEAFHQEVVSWVLNKASDATSEKFLVCISNNAPLFQLLNVC